MSSWTMRYDQENVAYPSPDPLGRRIITVIMKLKSIVLHTFVETVKE